MSEIKYYEPCMTKAQLDTLALTGQVTIGQEIIKVEELEFVNIEKTPVEIETTISSASTNSKAAGAKATYDFVNDSYQKITDNNLQTTNKTIPSAINEVNSIAKGAQQAVSYGNYSTMVTAFNSLASGVYSVGQNVMIVTLEVPDLWISSIETTSQTYTYTTDEAITTALQTDGYIQIGYYKLSALETSKVDLTDYVKNTDYASVTKAGVIKTAVVYGTQITGSAGIMTASTRTYEQYQNAADSLFIGKRTLENIITGKGLSSVSVSSTGTTTDEVGYITVNGVEKKLASGNIPIEGEW